MQLYRVGSYAGKIYLSECGCNLILPHDEIVRQRGEVVYNAQTGEVESGKVGKVSFGKDGSITYGDILSVGATTDGKIIVDINTSAISGTSGGGATIYINTEQMRNDFIRSLNTVIDGFENIKWAGAGAGAGFTTLSPYFY